MGITTDNNRKVAVYGTNHPPRDSEDTNLIMGNTS